jgi:hypothetical protein
LAFIGVFLWGYCAVVIPVYGYQGYTFNWPDVETMAWVVTLSMLPLLVIPLEIFKPSVLILWWIYLTAYVPSMVMPAIMLSMPASQLMPLQLSVLCTMLILCTVPYASTLVLPDFFISPSIFWWTFGIVWTVCIAILVTNISLSRVLSNYAFMLMSDGGSEYLVRSDYMAQVNLNGRYLGYVGRELVEALDPFLISFGLISKRWWMLAIGIFGQLFYVGQTGMKEVPVAIVLLVSVWLLRKYWPRFGLAALLGITGLIAFSTSFDLVTNSGRFTALVTRRAVAGPGQLTSYYFEHYSQVAHSGHSFTGSSSSQVYGPPREIGFYYFGSENVDANANLWAEGFAEFGIPGIFAFALILAISLWIYDSIAARGSFELAVLLAVIQADALSNSSPLTILVTHGGLLTGVLIYFAPQIRSSQWLDTRQSLPERRWIGRILPSPLS